MGVCSDDMLIRANKVDPKKFYDVIIYISSITEIIKGWNIKYREEFDKSILDKKIVKIGVIGNSNKGKSFILSKLSGINFPSGTDIKTEGLSIKYPDLNKNTNKNIVLLDSAGLETPVLKENSLNPRNIDIYQKKEQANVDEEKNSENDLLFRKKSREKIITESFLQNFIINNSDILIIVVGILSYSEQKLLNKIKTKMKKDNELKKATNTCLYIIHNLMTYTTKKQVQTYIDEVLLKSTTFDLEKKINVDLEKKEKDGISYFEKNTNLKIYHFIFANDYSEAGKYYNEHTLDLIKNSCKTIINSKGFDVVEEVKKRFKEEAKDYFQNIENEEIKFEGDAGPNNKKNSQNLPKLIRLQEPKNLKLKEIYIDEVGFSNLRANRFEPKYSCYKTKNHIIIKIEAPGKIDNIGYNVELRGEYIILKITGKKFEDDDEKSQIENNLYSGAQRDYGDFSIEIPIKQDKFFLKNAKPEINQGDGIIMMKFGIEQSVLNNNIKSTEK